MKGHHLSGKLESDSLLRFVFAAFKMSLITWNDPRLCYICAQIEHMDQIAWSPVGTQAHLSATLIPAEHN